MPEPAPASPPFHWLAISDGSARESGPDPVVARVRELAASSDPTGRIRGAFQLREKTLSDRELWRLARRCRGALPGGAAGLRLLLNGRLDIAAATGADGVHLPAAGLPPAAVRSGLDALRSGPGRSLLGVSTHSVDEVAAARSAGADYVTFGPVFRTPSKEPYGDPVGLGALERAVVAAGGMAVLALGGLSAERVASVIAAGASGIAGIRAFGDPVSRAEILSALETALPGV